MTKEVYKNVYMTVFPLTGNPLREINIFVIKTEDENLIIDTGFNNEENRANMDQMIKDLDLDLSKTKLFLTHLHSDHIGLAGYLQAKGVKEIYISEVDGDLVGKGMSLEGEKWQGILKNAEMQGLIGQAPSAENLSIDDHPGYKNMADSFDYIAVRPGDKLSIGDFNFTVIDEAGHTPGMVGLYDKEKSVLFCGDHILGKITPNITYWGEKYGDSLGIYLKNIEKLKEENIQSLFSSHRYLVEDVNQRIDQLLAHHAARLEDTLSIIENIGRANTTEITKKMHWDIRAKDWTDFPASQKWFAVGEASAHLIHLRDQGKIIEEVENGVAYYSLV